MVFCNFPFHTIQAISKVPYYSEIAIDCQKTITLTRAFFMESEPHIIYWPCTVANQTPRYAKHPTNFTSTVTFSYNCSLLPEFWYTRLYSL